MGRRAKFRIQWLTKVGLAVFSLGTTAAPPPKETFLSLLREYKHFTECSDLLKEDIQSIASVDPAAIANLPENSLAPRYREFNVTYLEYANLEKKVGQQSKELSSKLDNTPLSDLRNRGTLEIKTAATKSRHKQVRRVICMLSVQANKDIMQAILTLPPEKRVAAKPVPEKPKNLPGVSGPSRAERLKMSEAEKINLMPVDDEFYKTQLGRKLEADLGGKADYWSYDYQTDELYVKVGNETGKLSVREDSPGIRFMRTRVGSNFVDPVGGDTRVDNLSASGRFLTRNPTEETLFGAFPKIDPQFRMEPNSGPHPASSSSDGDH